LRPTNWAPSLETARKIDDEDTVQSIEAARYRFAASLANLERCYDEQASKLRAAFFAAAAIRRATILARNRPIEPDFERVLVAAVTTLALTEDEGKQ